MLPKGNEILTIFHEMITVLLHGLTLGSEGQKDADESIGGRDADVIGDLRLAKLHGRVGANAWHILQVP